MLSFSRARRAAILAGGGGRSTLNNNILLEWSLNNTASDAVGANNLSLVGSPTYTTGKVYAQALQTASGKYARAADSAAVGAGDSDWMWEVWFRTPASLASQEIISKWGADQQHAEFDCYVSGAGAVVFTVYQSGTGTGNGVTSSVTVTTSTWYQMLIWHDSVNNQVGISINGTATTAATTIAPTQQATAYLNLGTYGNGSGLYFTGIIGAVRKWSRILTASERTELYGGGNGKQYPFDGGGVTLTLTSPQAYQVFQRSGTTGTLTITGTLAGMTSDIEANWNGGAYTTVASNASGAFSGTLTGIAQGQATVDVRVKNQPGVSKSVAYVGVGEVFVIAGQSNASGRGTSNQTWTHATLKAGMFGNDYAWRILADPLDSSVGQIDTVSSDGAAAGSVWTKMASAALTDLGLPIAFVPCAAGGTPITSWQPGANHQDRTTLYGSMIYRLNQCGGARAILWWQGETDAYNSMATATYQSYLEAIANALATDAASTKLLTAILQKGNTYSDANAAKIQTAQANTVASKSNVEAGADLSAETAETGDHFVGDAAIATVAAAWWSAIKTAFGW